ncbi:unnamed protein product [Absidia cylindrospora]
MSYDKDKENQLNGYGVHGHQALQQLYNSTLQNNSPGLGSPVNGLSSPSHLMANSSGGYPMYASTTGTNTNTNNTGTGGGSNNNAFARYPMMSLGQQKLSQPLSHSMLSHTSSPTTPSDSLTMTNGMPFGFAAGSSHLSKQLSYAQLSRQSLSPHHHARTAAQVARSTPVSSTVTITDPTIPVNFSPNILLILLQHARHLLLFFFCHGIRQQHLQ